MRRCELVQVEEDRSVTCVDDGPVAAKADAGHVIQVCTGLPMVDDLAERNLALALHNHVEFRVTFKGRRGNGSDFRTANDDGHRRLVSLDPRGRVHQHADIPDVTREGDDVRVCRDDLVSDLLGGRIRPELQDRDVLVRQPLLIDQTGLQVQQCQRNEGGFAMRRGQADSHEKPSVSVQKNSGPWAASVDVASA